MPFFLFFFLCDHYLVPECLHSRSAGWRWEVTATTLSANVCIVAIKIGHLSVGVWYTSLSEPWSVLPGSRWLTCANPPSRLVLFFCPRSCMGAARVKTRNGSDCKWACRARSRVMRTIGVCFEWSYDSSACSESSDKRGINRHSPKRLLFVTCLD